MVHKTKNKNKNWFCRNCLQYFSTENVLIKHKEDCLSINGMQSVKVEERTFENNFKQIQFHLKFMLILGVILKKLKFMKVLTQKIS